MEDLLAIPEHERFHELIDGELVRKAMPSPRHGNGQMRLGEVLGPFHRRPGGPPDRPGGWWFATEAEVVFGDDVLRPDVAGWRRERLPVLPDESLVRVVPDWVCEILSPSNATNDTIRKKRIFHRFQVPHYWVLDPQQETLSVLRWSADGYIEVLGAERDDRVRAEPFAAIEVRVGVFFGQDEEDEPAPA